MYAPWEDDASAVPSGPLHWEDDDVDLPLLGESDDEWEPLPPTSGQLLVSHLLDLFVRRRLFAEEVCVAMHHAADKFEEAKPYALRPGLVSGKYSGHLKQMLGYTRDNTLLYDLSMPGKLKGSAVRVTWTPS